MITCISEKTQIKIMEKTTFSSMSLLSPKPCNSLLNMGYSRKNVKLVFNGYTDTKHEIKQHISVYSLNFLIRINSQIDNTYILT